MIRLNVQELLDQKGKSRYWLNKQLGMGYSGLKKMIEGKTRSISFIYIEALCNVLECTPNDLFTIDSEKPEGH